MAASYEPYFGARSQTSGAGYPMGPAFNSAAAAPHIAHNIAQASIYEDAASSSMEQFQYSPSMMEPQWLQQEQVAFSYAPGLGADLSDEELNESEDDLGPKSHPYFSHQAPPGTPLLASPYGHPLSGAGEAAGPVVDGAGPVTEGYQVIKLEPQSPASQAGLLPFFDFLLAADGVPLSEDIAEFGHRLSSKRGEGVLLSVYNTRQQSQRQVAVYPDDSGSHGGLLGCTIAWNDVETGYGSARQVVYLDPAQCRAEPALVVDQHFVIGVEEYPKSPARRICCFSAPDEMEYWMEQHSAAGAAPEDDVLLLIYDQAENSIFSTRVGLPAGLAVSAPMAVEIPPGSELPTFPEGGSGAPRAQAKQRSKGDAKKGSDWATRSPSIASEVDSPFHMHLNKPAPEPPGLLKDAKSEKIYPSRLVPVSFGTVIVLLTVFAAACVALGTFCIVIYAVTLKRGAHHQLSLWLIVHGVRTLVLLPFCSWCFGLLLCGRLRRQDPIVQLGLLLAAAGLLFAVIWLVVGTVWVFADPAIRHQSSLLYWSCFAVIILEYIHCAFWVCVFMSNAMEAMDRSDAAIQDMLVQMVAPRELDEFDHIP